MAQLQILKPEDMKQTRPVDVAALKLLVNKKRNAATMNDLYITTVVDRLDWIAAQTSSGKVFTTTDNLRLVVDSIFFIWECELENCWS